MKNKNEFIVAIAVIGCLIAATFASISNEDSVKQQVRLVLQSSKETYLLGEPIPLVLDIENVGRDSAIVVNTFDPVFGSLRISAHDESKKIAYEYANPKSGILEPNGFVEIGAGRKLTRSHLLLSRLNADRRPEFFFLAAGTYILKASYQVRFRGQDAPIRIESEPVTITIVPPLDEDLKAWNRIKNDGNFAYLMEDGEVGIPFYESKERARFQQEIEEVLREFPDAIYSTHLRQGLSKLREVEAKRQAGIEALQKQKP